MTAVRELRVTAHDGVQLFARVYGHEGPGPDWLLLDGLGCDGFVWRHLAPHWAKRGRVVHLHHRGHGRSELPPDCRGMDIETLADDAATVLERAEVPKVIAAGHSMGVQVALELHRRHPAHVAGLALVCGSPGRPLDSFHDSETLKHVFPYAKRAVERLPAIARAVTRKLLPTEFAFRFSATVELNPEWVTREDFMPYLRHLAKMDPVAFVRMATAAGAHSAEPHLPEIDVPTLVIAGERDRFTPPRRSIEMAEAIPRAELFVIRGGSHAAPIEQAELVQLAVDRFFSRRR